MSATPESTFTSPDQRIADLERQLAEREAELAEALKRETATAEVLQVINSSPGDLVPVFDAMLEKAMHLCGASFGFLTRIKGENFSAVALRGVPPAFAEFFRQPQRIVPGQAHHSAMRGADIIHIEDITTDEVYRSGDPARHALADIGGARTGLCVALRKEGKLLGTIVVYRKEVRRFTEKQIALLQNFAAQAVIAMENARLLTETREALEQQTATAEVLQVINSSPSDLAPVFDAMLKKATALCDAPFGIMQTYDGERFVPAASYGVPAPLAEFLAQDPSQPGPRTGLGRIARGADVVHIVDLADSGDIGAGDPRRRHLVKLGDVRSYVVVALRKEGKLLGAIATFRQEVRPFTDKQIALLQNFAQQAVIAMENARLLTETREGLEQQTAAAEVLQVINASRSDLAPVFNAILEKAMHLCEAAFGELRTYDGERFQSAAVQGVPAAFAEFRRHNAAPAGAGSLGARVLEGQLIAHIPDLKDEEPYRAGDENRRSLVDLGGARTALMASLCKDNDVFGFIILYRQQVQPFSEKQIVLLQNFAAQAVIAMENARLLTETREALEQQTATAEVLGVINSSPSDLAPVFNALLDKAIRLCAASHAHLFTFDGEYVRPVAVSGDPSFGEWLRQLGPTRPPPGSSVDRLHRGEPFVHVLDSREMPPYRANRWFHELIDRSGARAAINMPLRKDGALLGFISVYRQEVRPFTDKQIALLQNFADQAVIAMENARLLGELRQRTEEVVELNRGLEARVAEQVDELGRVGRLKRFLAPQLAEMIVSQGDEKILESHRREIVVVFCDLRGYTAFTETAEPEEVLEFLREYHGALGPLVTRFEGTLDQFSGDGIMVFFNDPVPCPDPAERAVKMAMAMREAAGKLITAWRRHGCELGFGAGIAQGYATLGQIGFSERSGYTAIGTVCNLAARLCAEAKDGQILVSSHIAEAVEAVARLEDLGNLELKGLRRPVATFNVVQSCAADARPNLTVVASGPGA